VYGETRRVVEMLQRGQSNRSEPHPQPRQRRHGKKIDRFAAKNLVPDRLIEQAAGGKTGRPPLALIEDALGFKQQGLAETLCSDDDEFVVSVRVEKVVDFGRAV